MFLDILARACGQFGLIAHAYCLMPNHYHLIAQTPGANLSRAMAWIQTTYSVRFNRRHNRSGHLFQGRFKAQVVEVDPRTQSDGSGEPVCDSCSRSAFPVAVAGLGR